MGLAPGVENSLGVGSIELYVSFTGKVIAKVGSSLWIDDGGGVTETSGGTGIVARYPNSSPLVNVGQFVYVRGALTGNIPAEFTTNRRYVVLGSVSDMSILY